MPSSSLVTHSFVKGETVKPQETFVESILNFKKRLMNRGYPYSLEEKFLSEIKLTERNPSSWNKTARIRKRNIAFHEKNNKPLVSAIKEDLEFKTNINNMQFTY